MIIGITGKAQSGKDTIAKHLVKRYGYTRYAFADPLKETLNPLFGWDERHSFGDLKDVVDPKLGFSPREAYQDFGTDFCRNKLNADFWLMKAEERIAGLRHVVIPDVRFENEAAWVRERGILFHVTRYSAKTIREHTSEQGVKFVKEDAMFFNSADILDLQIAVTEFMFERDFHYAD